MYQQHLITTNTDKGFMRESLLDCNVNELRQKYTILVKKTCALTDKMNQLKKENDIYKHSSIAMHLYEELQSQFQTLEDQFKELVCTSEARYQNLCKEKDDVISMKEDELNAMKLECEMSRGDVDIERKEAKDDSQDNKLKKCLRFAKYTNNINNTKIKKLEHQLHMKVRSKNVLISKYVRKNNQLRDEAIRNNQLRIEMELAVEKLKSEKICTVCHLTNLEDQPNINDSKVVTDGHCSDMEHKLTNLEVEQTSDSEAIDIFQEIEMIINNISKNKVETDGEFRDDISDVGSDIINSYLQEMRVPAILSPMPLDPCTEDTGTQTIHVQCKAISTQVSVPLKNSEVQTLLITQKNHATQVPRTQVGSIQIQTEAVSFQKSEKFSQTNSITMCNVDIQTDSQESPTLINAVEASVFPLHVSKSANKLDEVSNKHLGTSEMMSQSLHTVTEKTFNLVNTEVQTDPYHAYLGLPVTKQIVETRITNDLTQLCDAETRMNGTKSEVPLETKKTAVDVKIQTEGLYPLEKINSNLFSFPNHCPIKKQNTSPVSSFDLLTPPWSCDESSTKTKVPVFNRELLLRRDNRNFNKRLASMNKMKRVLELQYKTKLGKHLETIFSSLMSASRYNKQTRAVHDIFSYIFDSDILGTERINRNLDYFLDNYARKQESMKKVESWMKTFNSSEYKSSIIKKGVRSSNTAGLKREFKNVSCQYDKNLRKQAHKQSQKRPGHILHNLKTNKRPTAKSIFGSDCDSCESNENSISQTSTFILPSPSKVYRSDTLTDVSCSSSTEGCKSTIRQVNNKKRKYVDHYENTNSCSSPKRKYTTSQINKRSEQSQSGSDNTDCSVVSAPSTKYKQKLRKKDPVRKAPKRGPSTSERCSSKTKTAVSDNEIRPISDTDSNSCKNSGSKKRYFLRNRSKGNQKSTCEDTQFPCNTTTQKNLSLDNASTSNKVETKINRALTRKINSDKNKNNDSVTLDEYNKSDEILNSKKRIAHTPKHHQSDLDEDRDHVALSLYETQKKTVSHTKTNLVNRINVKGSPKACNKNLYDPITENVQPSVPILSTSEALSFTTCSLTSNLQILASDGLNSPKTLLTISTPCYNNKTISTSVTPAKSQDKRPGKSQDTGSCNGTVSTHWPNLIKHGLPSCLTLLNNKNDEMSVRKCNFSSQLDLPTPKDVIKFDENLLPDRITHTELTCPPEVHIENVQEKCLEKISSPHNEKNLALISTTKSDISRPEVETIEINKSRLSASDSIQSHIEKTLSSCSTETSPDSSIISNRVLELCPVTTTWPQIPASPTKPCIILKRLPGISAYTGKAFVQVQLSQLYNSTVDSLNKEVSIRNDEKCSTLTSNTLLAETNCISVEEAHANSAKFCQLNSINLKDCYTILKPCKNLNMQHPESSKTLTTNLPEVTPTASELHITQQKHLEDSHSKDVIDSSHNDVPCSLPPIPQNESLLAVKLTVIPLERNLEVSNMDVEPLPENSSILITTPDTEEKELPQQKRKLTKEVAENLLMTILKYESSYELELDIARKFIDVNAEIIASTIVKCLIKCIHSKTEQRKPRRLYTSPAHKKLLGFLFVLKELRGDASFMSTILDTTELSIMQSTKCAFIVPITQFYIAYCMLYSNIFRVRFFIIKALYKMGDHVLPMLYTSISNWLAVFNEFKNDSLDALERGVVQIIRKRISNDVNLSAYNVIQLLSQCLRYPMDAEEQEVLVMELLLEYFDKPDICRKYVIIMLCQTMNIRTICTTIEQSILKKQSELKLNDIKNVINCIEFILDEFKSHPGITDNLEELCKQFKKLVERADSQH